MPPIVPIRSCPREDEGMINLVVIGRAKGDVRARWQAGKAPDDGGTMAGRGRTMGGQGGMMGGMMREDEQGRLAYSSRYIPQKNVYSTNEIKSCLWNIFIL